MATCEHGCFTPTACFVCSAVSSSSFGGGAEHRPREEGYRPEGTVKGTGLHPGPLLLAPPGPVGPLLVSSGVGVVPRCRVAAGASRPSGPEVGGERRSRRTRRDDEPHFRSVLGVDIGRRRFVELCLFALFAPAAAPHILRCTFPFTQNRETELEGHRSSLGTILTQTTQSQRITPFKRSLCMAL